MSDTILTELPQLLGADRTVILRWILKKHDVHWIHLAQDRDLWQDRVNKVIDLRVPQIKAGNFLAT
jgi:hypothetical protein